MSTDVRFARNGLPRATFLVQGVYILSVARNYVPHALLLLQHYYSREQILLHVQPVTTSIVSEQRSYCLV